MRFKLIGGNHVEDGKTYSKGAVISTPRNLKKMFGDKFERIAGPEDHIAEPPPAIPAPVLPTKAEGPQQPESKKELQDSPNLSESQAITNVEPELSAEKPEIKKKTKKKVVRRKAKNA